MNKWIMKHKDNEKLDFCLKRSLFILIALFVFLNLVLRINILSKLVNVGFNFIALINTILIFVIVIIVILIFIRNSENIFGRNRDTIAVLNTFGFLLIAIVGGFWTILQYRNSNDYQMKIQIGDPEIYHDEKTDEYFVNISTQVFNSGKNVGIVFVDNEYSKREQNKKFNECLNDKVASCFAAEKINFKNDEMVVEKIPFSKIKSTFNYDLKNGFIRKGVSYDYSALYRLKEPGWYCLSFTLAVDYNKDIIPFIDSEYNIRYATWYSKKYVLVGGSEETGIIEVKSEME